MTPACLLFWVSGVSVHRYAPETAQRWKFAGLQVLRLAGLGFSCFVQPQASHLIPQGHSLPRRVEPRPHPLKKRGAVHR